MRSHRIGGVRVVDRQPGAQDAWTAKTAGEDLAEGAVFPLRWKWEGGDGGVALWADVRGTRQRVGADFNPWLPGLYDFSVGADGRVRVVLDRTFAGGSVTCPATTFTDEFLRTLRP